VCEREKERERVSVCVSFVIFHLKKRIHSDNKLKAVKTCC
jgi:hypothetical protein